MGTQKNIAAQIQQAQAEYILCLKANHPTVFEQLNAWFKTAIAQGCLPRPSEHTTEAGHHRTEIRSCGRSRSTNCPSCIKQLYWMGLQTIVIVERTRYLWNKLLRSFVHSRSYSFC